jgi:hypothetical protein
MASWMRSVVVNYHIDHAGDTARLVQAGIHVEDRDGLREVPDRKVAGGDVLRVDEVSGCSTVDQSLHRHPHSGLDRL